MRFVAEQDVEDPARKAIAEFRFVHLGFVLFVRALHALKPLPRHLEPRPRHATSPVCLLEAPGTSTKACHFPRVSA
jgi:hypothetical protein